MFRSAILLLSVFLLASCGSDSKNSNSDSLKIYTLYTPDTGYSAYRLEDQGWKKTNGILSLGALTDEAILEVACFDKRPGRNDYYSVTRMLLKHSVNGKDIKPCDFLEAPLVTVIFENKSPDIGIVDIRSNRYPIAGSFPASSATFTEVVDELTDKFFVIGKKGDMYYYSKISTGNLSDGKVISIDFRDTKSSGLGVKLNKGSEGYTYIYDYYSPLEDLYVSDSGRSINSENNIFKIPKHLRHEQDFYVESWFLKSGKNQFSYSTYKKDIEEKSQIENIDNLSPVRLSIENGAYLVVTNDDVPENYSHESVSFIIQDSTKKISVNYINNVNSDRKINLIDFRTLPDFPYNESAINFSEGTKYSVNKLYQTNMAGSLVNNQRISKSYIGDL